jgi:hypothetical protein
MLTTTDGEGVTEDREAAVAWYRKAATADQDTADPDVMRKLGDAYYDGIGACIDRESAVAWYSKAADIAPISYSCDDSYIFATGRQKCRSEPRRMTIRMQRGSSDPSGKRRERV